MVRTVRLIFLSAFTPGRFYRSKINENPDFVMRVID